MKALLAVLMLLACSPAAIADETQPSQAWLIFEYPHIHELYGKIRGQARPIVSAWLTHEAKAIYTVMVSYRDSQTVPVSFLIASHAEAFLRDIQAGKSVDLTACAHPEFVYETPRDRTGCFDRIYETKFHCDALSPFDSAQIVSSPKIISDDDETHEGDEVTIRRSMLQCPSQF